jgi:ribosomal protein S27E
MLNTVIIYGERSQVVKAVVCGTTIRGFKSHRSPLKLIII